MQREEVEASRDKYIVKSSINSFKNIFYVLGIELGIGARTMNNTEIVPAIKELIVWWSNGH
jgi:hypothetical protein